MYPVYTNVVLSANKFSDPVVNVTIGVTSIDNNNAPKTLFRKSTYSINAMLMQLRASRRKLSKALAVEQTKVCRPAGETDSLDDVIEQLLCLDFMVSVSGIPFNPELLQSNFGVTLPYKAGHKTKALVKEFLLKDGGDRMSLT